MDMLWLEHHVTMESVCLELDEEARRGLHTERRAPGICSYNLLRSSHNCEASTGRQGKHSDPLVGVPSLLSLPFMGPNSKKAMWKQRGGLLSAWILFEMKNPRSYWKGTGEMIGHRGLQILVRSHFCAYWWHFNLFKISHMIEIRKAAWKSQL